MTDPSAIDELLAHARRNLDRVPVDDLADEVARGAILIDIRPLEQRTRDGDLPGAIVVDRNVLEWRLDPTSPDRCPSQPGPTCDWFMRRGIQLESGRRDAAGVGSALRHGSGRRIPRLGAQCSVEEHRARRRHRNGAAGFDPGPFTVHIGPVPLGTGRVS